MDAADSRSSSMTSQRRYGHTRRSGYKDSTRLAMKLNSPEGQQFRDMLAKTNFDPKFNDSYWRIEGVEFVEHERLKMNFQEYKDELVSLGRKQEDMKEILVFSAETKHACEEICRIGHRVGFKKRHVLGHTGSGIHLVRHYDILTRYMIYQQFSAPAYIVVYKTFLGKCKPIVPRLHKDDNYVRPYVGFDCHVSARPVEKKMHICDALNCSYIYLYEHDEVSSNPVRYPRQVLPYAIIHLETKPPISLEYPFMAISNGNRYKNWEVKGETRRGFRFVSTQCEPKSRIKRPYKRNMVTTGKACLKEQLLEMRSKSCMKEILNPPTLVKYDKEKIKGMRNSTEKETCTEPPFLQKYGTYTVNFAGEKFSISSSGQRKEKRANTCKTMGKDDKDVDSSIKYASTINRLGTQRKNETSFCKKNIQRKPRVRKVSQSGLPLSLKPFVSLKRLDSGIFKSKFGVRNTKKERVIKRSGTLNRKQSSIESSPPKDKEQNNLSKKLHGNEDVSKIPQNQTTINCRSDTVSTHGQQIVSSESIAVITKRVTNKKEMENKINEIGESEKKDTTQTISPLPKKEVIAPTKRSRGNDTVDKLVSQPKVKVSETKEVHVSKTCLNIETSTNAINAVPCNDIKITNVHKLPVETMKTNSYSELKVKAGTQNSKEKKRKVTNQNGISTILHMKACDKRTPTGNRDKGPDVYTFSDSDTIIQPDLSKSYTSNRCSITPPVHPNRIVGTQANETSTNELKQGSCKLENLPGIEVTSGKSTAQIHNTTHKHKPHCSSYMSNSSKTINTTTHSNATKLKGSKPLINGNDPLNQHTKEKMCHGMNKKKWKDKIVMVRTKGNQYSIVENKSENSNDILSDEPLQKARLEKSMDKAEKSEKKTMLNNKTTTNNAITQSKNNRCDDVETELESHVRTDLSKVDSSRCANKSLSCKMSEVKLKIDPSNSNIEPLKESIYSVVNTLSTNTTSKPSVNACTISDIPCKDGVLVALLDSCVNSSQSQEYVREKASKQLKLAACEQTEIAKKRSNEQFASTVIQGDVMKDCEGQVSSTKEVDQNYDEFENKGKLDNHNVSVPKDDNSNKHRRPVTHSQDHNTLNDDCLAKNKTNVNTADTCTEHVNNQIIETETEIRSNDYYRSDVTVSSNKTSSSDINLNNVTNKTIPDDKQLNQNSKLLQENTQSLKITRNTNSFRIDSLRTDARTAADATSKQSLQAEHCLRETNSQLKQSMPSAIEQLLIANPKTNQFPYLNNQELISVGDKIANDTTMNEVSKKQSKVYGITYNKVNLSNTRSPPAAVAAPAVLNVFPTVAAAQTDEHLSTESQTQRAYISSREKLGIHSSSQKPNEFSQRIPPAHSNRTCIMGKRSAQPKVATPITHTEVYPNAINAHNQVFTSMVPSVTQTLSHTHSSIKNPHPVPFRTPPYIHQELTSVITSSCPPKAHLSLSTSKASSIRMPSEQSLAHILRQPPPQPSVMSLIQFRQKFPSSHVHIANAMQKSTTDENTCHQPTTESPVAEAAIQQTIPMYVDISTITNDNVSKHLLIASNTIKAPVLQKVSTSDRIKFVNIRDSNSSSIATQQPITQIPPQTPIFSAPKPTLSESQKVGLSKMSVLKEALTSPIPLEILPIPKSTFAVQDQVRQKTNNETTDHAKTYPTKKAKKYGSSAGNKSVKVDENTAKRLQQFLSKLTWAQRQNLIESEKCRTNRFTSNPDGTKDNLREQDKIVADSSCGIETTARSSRDIKVHLSSSMPSTKYLRYSSDPQHQPERQSSAETEVAEDPSTNLLLPDTESLQEFDHANNPINQVTTESVTSKDSLTEIKHMQTKESNKHNSSTKSTVHQSHISKSRDFLAEFHDNDSSDTVIGGVEIISSVSKYPDNFYAIPKESNETTACTEEIKEEIEHDELADNDSSTLKCNDTSTDVNSKIMTECISDITENGKSNTEHYMPKENCFTKDRVSLFDNFVPTRTVLHYDQTSTLSVPQCDEITNDKQLWSPFEIKLEPKHENDNEKSELKSVSVPVNKQHYVKESKTNSDITPEVEVTNSSIFSRIAERRRINMNTVALKSPDDCRIAIIETLQELSDVLKFLNDSRSDPVTDTTPSKAETARQKHSGNSKQHCESNRKKLLRNVTEPIYTNAKETVLYLPLPEKTIKKERNDDDVANKVSNTTEHNLSVNDNSTKVIPGITQRSDDSFNVTVKTEPLEESGTSSDYLSNSVTNGATAYTNILPPITHSQTETNVLNDISKTPYLNIRENGNSSSSNDEEYFTATKVIVPKPPNPPIVNAMEYQVPLSNSSEQNAHYGKQTRKSYHGKHISNTADIASADDLPVLFDLLGQPDITLLESFGNTIKNSKSTVKAKSNLYIERNMTGSKTLENNSIGQESKPRIDTTETDNLEIARNYTFDTNTCAQQNNSCLQPKRTSSTISAPTINTKDVLVEYRDHGIAPLTLPGATTGSLNSHQTKGDQPAKNQHVCENQQIVSISMLSENHSYYPENKLDITTNQNTVQAICSIDSVVKPSKSEVGVQNHNDNSGHGDNIREVNKTDVSNNARKTSAKPLQKLVKPKNGKNKTRFKGKDFGNSKPKGKDIIPFHIVMQKKREQFRKFKNGQTNEKFINYNEFKKEFDKKSKKDVERTRKTNVFVKHSRRPFHFKVGNFNNGNKFRNPKSYIHCKKVDNPSKRYTIGIQRRNRKNTKISNRGTKFYEDFSGSDNEKEQAKVEHVSLKRHCPSSDHLLQSKKKCYGSNQSVVKDTTETRSHSRTKSKSRCRSTSKEKCSRGSRSHSIHSKSSKGSNERSRSRSRRISNSATGSRSSEQRDHNRDKSSQNKHLSPTRSDKSDDSYGGFDAMKYNHAYETYDATKYVEQPTTKPRKQRIADPPVKRCFQAKTPFQKGGTGYFQWKKKYQTNSSAFKCDTVIQKKGQSKEEAERWHKFKMRENIRIQIENAVKEYRRTFQDTSDDMKGDEKVSSYLHFLTGKLNVIQTKRNIISTPNMHNRSGHTIKKPSKEKHHENTSSSRNEKTSYHDDKTDEKLKRAVLWRKHHRDKHSNHDTVSTLVDSFTQETTNMPNRLAKKNKVIEGMLRQHFMKHVEHVTNQIKNELTHEIVKGMKDSRDTHINEREENRSHSHHSRKERSPLPLDACRRSSREDDKRKLYDNHRKNYVHESESDRNDNRHHSGDYMRYREMDDKVSKYNKNVNIYFDGNKSHSKHSYHDDWVSRQKDTHYTETPHTYNQDESYIADSYNDDRDFANDEGDWNYHDNYRTADGEYEEREVPYEDEIYSDAQYNGNKHDNRNNRNSDRTSNTGTKIRHYHRYYDKKTYHDTDIYHSHIERKRNQHDDYYKKQPLLSTPSFDKDSGYKQSFNRHSFDDRDISKRSHNQDIHFEGSYRGHNRSHWRGNFYEKPFKRGNCNNNCSNFPRDNETHGKRRSHERWLGHNQFYGEENNLYNEDPYETNKQHQNKQYSSLSGSINIADKPSNTGTGVKLHDNTPSGRQSTSTSGNHIPVTPSLEQTITAGLKSLKKEIGAQPIPTISGLRNKSEDIIPRPSASQYPYPSASSTF